MTCIVKSKINGKQSELFDNLLKALGTEELANRAYTQAEGKEFAKRFGAWTKGQLINADLVRSESINHIGEPRLHKKKNQYFFITPLGERIDINKMKFPELTPAQVIEITGQLTHKYVNAKKKDHDYNDPDSLNLSNESLSKSIEDSMTEYIKLYPKEQDKVDTVLRYKDDFIEEVKFRIKDAGFKFTDEGTNESGEPLNEISEDDKTTAINIAQNYETSSKDTAGANVKLMMSQIENVIQEGKQFKIKEGDYLKFPSFVEFDEVWETILPILSDITGYSKGDNVISTFDQMTARLLTIKRPKPWVMNLVETLKSLDKNKKLEFSQAMNKVRLNFNVTEYNPATGSYVIINATSTNSAGSKVKNSWSQNFRSKFMGTTPVIHSEGIIALNEIKTKLKDSRKRLSEISEKQGNNKAIVAEGATLRGLLAELGIEIDGIHLRSFIEVSNKEDFSVQDTQGIANFNTVAKLYKRVNAMIGKVITSKTLIVNSEYKSPFDNESVLTSLAYAKGLYSSNLSESSVLMNKGKTAFSYSTPSYLHNRINTLKENYAEIQKINSQKFNKNSRWTQFMAASEIIDGNPAYKAEKREIQSERRMAKIQLGLAGSFKTKGKNDGVDAKTITEIDAINDTMAKMFGAKTNGKTIFQTMIAADKSKKIEIEGMPFFDSKTSFTNGKYTISQETIDIFIGYFTDEWNRMKRVQKEIDTLPDSKLIDHYHTKEKNGLKSQLFPNFSTGMGNTEIEGILYKDGKVVDNNTNSFTQSQKNTLSKFIKLSLERRFGETISDLMKNNMLIEDASGLSNVSLSKSLLSAYIGTESPIHSLLADYTLNGIISNIEYGKVFSGDPAYYKNTTDMIKRIPGSYSDGLQLELTKKEHLKLNIAVIDGVNVASSYIKIIEDSLTDKSLAKAYKKINTTDAQAWITPNRWRFLMTRLGKWNNRYTLTYNKMIKGEKLKEKEQRLVMQPLKGVYFGVNDNGVPTYLKYSQAVLIPSLVKGTQMQALYDKMTIDPETGISWSKQGLLQNEIHEVITIDGVKVGAKGVSTIHKKGKTDLLDKFDLNVIELSNRNWKLQQDLPTKLDKPTNLGSQIQKNILAEISVNLETIFDVEGREVTGHELYDEIQNTVSMLSNIGVDEVSSKFGIGADNKITNKDALYDALIEEFRGRGANENVISALEKSMPLDAIPQVGNKIQGVFMSIMNKSIVKIQTSGGAYIQVSPFGFEKILDPLSSGIKIVSDNYDKKGLKPPRVVKVDGKDVVLPGQAFLPHSAIAKLLPEGVDFSKMSGEDLQKYIDPSALEVITYRIPNQGMSSNDMLEIVGILPEGMGDSIMAWDGIPAKTGSDFDIDKMFAMMPNLHFNKLTGKVEKKRFSKNAKDKESVQNRLFNLYKSLLSSPSNYDNLMKSIDESRLKDDISGNKDKGIKGLSVEKTMESLQLFSPTQQIRTKFEYMSGKTGVAQTANHLVDHNANQMENIGLSSYIGIGNKSANGNTKFDEIFDEKGQHKIGDIISEFLNAYVDIAKDPYISRGNHNNITANTTFMLLRAGVPLKWVNRFIAQPIIVDYVKYKKLSEGKTVEPLKINDIPVTPIDFLIEKYDIEDDMHSAKKTAKASKFSVTKMEKIIRNEVSVENMSSGERYEQAQILTLFKEFESIGDDLAQSVKASKADTKGATGSFTGRLVAQNIIQDVIEKRSILGFEDKITGDSAIATYTLNTIGWVGDVVHSSDLFLPAKKGLESTFNLISNMATGQNLMDKELADVIAKSYTAYNMSKLPIFSDLNKKSVHDDLFIELPKRLEAFKTKNKNFLIDNLELRYSGGYTYIKLDSRIKTTTYENQMYRAWSAMLDSKNPSERKLGEDLVKYSFAQSGFNNNLNEFYTHIPHHYLIEKGIIGAIEASFEDTENYLGDEDFINQLFRHNVQNDKLVPKVNSLNIKDIKTPFGGGFVLQSDKFITKKDNGENYWPPFTKMQSNKTAVAEGEESSPRYNLYKLTGFTQIGSEDAPVYEITHKLGTKSNHGSIFEYSYGKTSLGSFVKENQLSEQYNKLVTQLRNEIGYDRNAYLSIWQGNNFESILREDRPNSMEGLVTTATDRKLIVGIGLDDINLPQEERNNVGKIEAQDVFKAKIDYFKKKMNVEVIIDENIETSRLLAATDPLAKGFNKPVILINPNNVFETTVIHEFAHVMIDSMPGGIENPRLKKALKQLEGSSIWSDTKALYPDLSDTMFAKEVLAQAIGVEGAGQWNNEVEQSSFMSILNWIFDYFNRTFGLGRDQVKSLALELISEKKFDVTGFQSLELQEQRTKSEALTKRKKTENRILDTITNLYNLSKKRAGRDKEYKATQYAEDLDKLNAELQEYNENNEAHIVESYVEWSSTKIAHLELRIDNMKREAKAKDTFIQPEAIRSIYEFMNSFSVLQQVQDMMLEESNGLNVAEKALVTAKIDAVLSTYAKISKEVDSMVRISYAHSMTKDDHKIRAEWETRFREEFDSIQPQGYTELEYVAEKINENLEAIQKETFEFFLEKAELSDKDISKASIWMVTEKNSGSAEVQIADKMFDANNNKLAQFTQLASSRYKVFNEKLKETFQGVSNKERYGKIVDMSENGAYFLSEFKADFVAAERESSKNNDPQYAAETYAEVEVKDNKYLLNGKWVAFNFKDKGKVVGDFYIFPNKQEVPISKAIGMSERRIWLKENTEFVNNSFGAKVSRPNKKLWGNKDYAKLSKDELAHLNQFKQDMREAQGLFSENGRLFRRFNDVEFIALPRITKTNTDRALGGDLLGSIKDAVKDLYRAKSDETEFAEGRLEENAEILKMSANSNNQEVLTIPIPFGRDLNDKEQSLDLPSLVLMYLAKGKDYELKRGVESKLQVMLMAMESRNVISRDVIGRRHVHAGLEGDKSVFKDKLRGFNDATKFREMIERRVYNKQHLGSTKMTKITGSALGFAGKVSLMFNTATEIVNAMTGMIGNFNEASGGEFFNRKDLLAGYKEYANDFGNILSDVGTNVQVSKTSLYLNMFNTQGEKNFLNNNFENRTRARALAKFSNIRMIATGGENMMHATLMYATLNGIKVINSKGQFLNKDGNVVKNEKDALTLKDAFILTKNADGSIIMKLPSFVRATTFSKEGKGASLEDIQDNILTETRGLINKLVIDIHGNYNKDTKEGMQRLWFGKIGMYLRNWMITTTTRRFRGILTVHKKVENLTETDRHFSQDKKDFEEGNYITVARFLIRTIPGAYREHGLNAIKKGWNNMSKMEKANMRRSLSEFAMIAVVVMLANGLDPDEDDEIALRAKYYLLREISELTFYTDPNETLRLMATPTAYMGFIEKVAKLLRQLADPTERYQQGTHKNRYKIAKKSIDLIPIWAQHQKDIRDALEFME